jgi:hypothetical protein
MRNLGAFPANRIDLNAGPKVFHLPTWKSKDDPARVAALRDAAMKAGRDPRMATFVVGILKGAGLQSSRGAQPAAVLLKWVQDNVFYATEPGERLQDPIYTLSLRQPYGDCDDLAMLLGAMYESIRLPWRFVLSGQDGSGKLVRWVEGQPRKRARWSHIYMMVGDDPYKPKVWRYAEPTLKKPLGWDVVSHVNSGGGSVMSELSGVEEAAENHGATVLRGKPGIWQEIVEKTKEQLHPTRVVPLVIAGLVTGFLAESLRETIRGKEK